MASVYKTIGTVNVAKEVKKMLQHFHDFNFIKYDNKKLKLSFNGENVKQHINNEWLISNSINCDEPAFVSPTITRSSVCETLKEVKGLIKALPCNIIGMNSVNDSLNSACENSDIVDEVKSYFKENSGVLLRRYLVCDSECVENYFYKMLRDRQIWWKKFSASPGRFTISQVFNNEEEEFVDIQYEFPWGLTTVERIKHIPNVSNNCFKNCASLSFISSEINAEKTAMVFLFDSYEIMDGNKRKLLRFHHKLAPFKICFSAAASEPNDERNLKDLALLLTKQIRKNSISVLLLNDMCSSPLEEQIFRNDALGIPYTVVMDEKTLKNGLLGIRSRDTTLTEQSHVSMLVPYVEKLMKNY